jgi:hypothetical protein
MFLHLTLLNLQLRKIDFPTALPGIEPRMPDPKSGVLPITPQGNVLV